MADNLTKTQRSNTMSKIKSKWTKQERTIHALLKEKRIKHKMHPKIEGSPDLILPEKKTAIFLHGCFWHACSKCYIEPKTNRKYWLPKIEGNKKRDKKNISALKKQGWKVKIVWEHEIKQNPQKAFSNLIK